jgi:pimeloyl-ACP methyl ester carboxylesterase
LYWNAHRVYSHHFRLETGIEPPARPTVGQKFPRRESPAMPRVERDWGNCYYETEGEGETVAFVGDLGYGAWQWAWQHAAVAGPFEALAWDLRGTGRSDCPAGPYSLEGLAADLEAVLSDHGARRTHLVSGGLGGLVALRYALDHGRARSLVLLGTSAGGPHLPDVPVERLFAPLDDPDALRETLGPVLTEAFGAKQPDVVDGIVEWRAGDGGGDAPREGWRAQAAALEGVDLHDELVEITLPALVVHGTADGVWPAAGGERLAAGLPRGRYEPIDGGPHLIGVERSRDVNDLLVGFLEAQTDR